MKIGELLRQVANVVDAQQARHDSEHELAQTTQAAEIEQARHDAGELQAGQIAQLVQAAQNAKAASAMDGDGVGTTTVMPTEPPADDELTSADNDDMTCRDTMVAPLQQKHELLKKATDVENHVDAFADDLGSNEYLQKLAGINPAALIVAADDSAEVD